MEKTQIAKIKFLVMDVDGTLTDGKIYMSDSGELFKAFNIKDGCGIKEILPKHKIIPVIITARNSKMLENRCHELGIVELHQGCRDKLRILYEIIEKYSKKGTTYSLSNVLYAGDDLLDAPCMGAVVAAGGIAACPLDAIAEIKCMSNYVSSYRAGDGAIRDIIEHTIKSPERNEVSVKIMVSEAIEYLKALDMSNIRVGTYNVTEDFYYMVKEIPTMHESECKLETHNKYIDIQWVIDGAEVTKISNSLGLVCTAPYDESKDIAFWLSKPGMTEVHMNPGSYIIMYPGEAHMPLIAYGEPSMVKLLVAKIRAPR